MACVPPKGGAGGFGGADGDDPGMAGFPDASGDGGATPTIVPFSLLGGGPAGRGGGVPIAPPAPLT